MTKLNIMQVIILSKQIYYKCLFLLICVFQYKVILSTFLGHLKHAHMVNRIDF